MGFLDKPVFGRKKQTFDELKRELRPRPDADGVTRVFSKELWDDPRLGAALRASGINPDDEKNIVRTAADWMAIFQQAEKDLIARTVAWSRQVEARTGYCRAIPLLVIGKAIYNGPHGAFLYGQMDLIGFDDWNVVHCALDERTRQACGLPGFPGDIPAMNQAMERKVLEWKRRYEFALESFGVTATGGTGGISREQCEQVKQDIRAEIIDHVAAMKPRIVAELHRVQGTAQG